MREMLLRHRARYPKSDVQDMIKLLYQSELGGGHMIPDSNVALARLRAEYEATPQRADIPLLEAIGPDISRLYLGAMDAAGLSVETVNALFCYTAAHVPGTMAGLQKKLNLLEDMLREGSLDLPCAQSLAYLAQYRAQGCPAQSHSPLYHDTYAPAYRLVPAQVGRYLPLLQKMEALRARGGIVAIDGNSGSGKSTLGAFLQAVYGGELFHMDDFFLPFDRKTPQRLAQPGGNVDHERFAAEILAHRPGSAFTYRPFQCHTGTLGDGIAVSPQPLWIVEGSYSLHSALVGAYDLKVMLRVTPQEQSRRILQREGPQMHQRFLREWIPLENAYFQSRDMDALCDVVLQMD